MKPLRDLALERISDPEAFKSQSYIDAEVQYIQNWWQRIQQTKKLHFIRLCKWYYINCLKNNKCAYQGVDFSEMPHWKLAQWAACEMCFGHYHKKNEWRIVLRILAELNHEHQNGRELNFPSEKFVNAYNLHTADGNGTVHDWYKILLHVPKKILQYEEFFG